MPGTTIGAFPGMSGLPRQAIRTPSNPLDKSTVVSLFPKPIHEVKCTLQPGTFDIEPGTYEKPAFLVVGTSSWWKDTDPDHPLLEIPTSSIVVADSIVKDYCNGIFQCDMGDKMPGLFFIPGDIDRKALHKDHQHLVDMARDRQKNWYRALVEAGDSLWSSSKGNPRCISDDMKIAAGDLQLEKSWMRDFKMMKMDNCPACGELRDSNYPICQSCQTIVNPEQYRELGFQTAKAV